MDKLNSDGSLAYAGSDALGGTAADIAGGKYTRDACLQKIGIAINGPSSGRFAVFEKVGASQDETFGVALDGAI